MVTVKCAYDKMVPLGELKMNPKNPNMHPTHQVAVLAKIMKSQGWRTPVTVSKLSGFMVRGHGRYLAATQLGCGEAPVDFQDYESLAEEWADLLADNQIPELAEINEELLAGLVKEIGSLGFDVELTGLQLDELDDILNGLEIPEGKEKSPQVKVNNLGQLKEKWAPENSSVWNIGFHRLMCGDTTSVTDFARLMGGRKADMVFTDPPYNMDYKSKSLGGLHNDRLSEAGFVRLILSSTHAMTQFLRTGGSYYICMSAAEYGMVIHQLRKLGCPGVPLIWVKPGTGLGSQEYRPQFEVILYGYTGSRSERTWHGKRRQSNLWKFDAGKGVTAVKTLEGGMVLELGLGFDTVSVFFDDCMDGTVINADASTSALWPIGRESEEYVHPTQKPIPLVKRAIRNSSNRGDLIIDGFLGSGTTMLAAEETGRVCYGVELDPTNVAVILERMSQLGLEPEKEA